MEISITNLQRKVPISPVPIKKIVQTIFKSEGIRQGSLSIVFVTSQKIRALNQKYLNRKYATDVLAFDLRIGQKDFSGEVIISTDVSQQNAKRFKTSVKHELTLYVIHGVLHLLGYDDHSLEDKKIMREKEIELLKEAKR